MSNKKRKTCARPALPGGHGCAHGTCLRYWLNREDGVTFTLVRFFSRTLLTNHIFNIQVTDGPLSQPHLESDNVRRKQMELIDAGLMFNSPYPPLLRRERSVDMILSFDFSARETDEERPFKVLTDSHVSLL